MGTVYDRHVYLHGSSNCGKSFILSPLKVIFQYILQSSYLLLRMDRGRGSPRVTFLNDFRWELKLIAWADLWQALERDAVLKKKYKTYFQGLRFQNSPNIWFGALLTK